MGCLRIRWTAAGRAILAVLGVVVAALVLPGLLAPPAPPPVPASVGLASVVRPRPPQAMPDQRRRREQPRIRPERPPISPQAIHRAPIHAPPGQRHSDQPPEAEDSDRQAPRGPATPAT